MSRAGARTGIGFVPPVTPPPRARARPRAVTPTPTTGRFRISSVYFPTLGEALTFGGALTEAGEAYCVDRAGEWFVVSKPGFAQWVSRRWLTRT